MKIDSKPEYAAASALLAGALILVLQFVTFRVLFPLWNLEGFAAGQMTAFFALVINVTATLYAMKFVERRYSSRDIYNEWELVTAAAAAFLATLVAGAVWFQFGYTAVANISLSEPFASLLTALVNVIGLAASIFAAVYLIDRWVTD